MTKLQFGGGTWTEVGAYPACDLCGETAYYDAATTLGPWANLCQTHFDQIGLGLGVGVGQQLQLRDAAPIATVTRASVTPTRSGIIVIPIGFTK